MKNKTNKYKYKDKNSRYQKRKTAGLPKHKRSEKGAKLPKFDDKMRLNKYLAHAGVCSRREADVLIQTGVVKVNGKIITEMGYKVNRTDKVQYDNITLQLEKNRYVLLNKPWNFSLKDRKTNSIYNLVNKACKEYILPVGKMSKSAAGLLLMTNDSDMIKKLSHPKFKVSQLFHIKLEKSISVDDLEKMEKGMYVDDKMFSVEEAKHVRGKKNNEIGVKVFSSNFNIVILMLGKLNHKVNTIDRVEYAGLTKIDLPRGRYRHLSEKEVGFLKMS